MTQKKIDAGRFYAEYHGHPLDQLEAVQQCLARTAEATIFLAGDSSLDNKHWFFDKPNVTSDSKAEQLRKTRKTRKGGEPYAGQFIDSASNGYENILEPPKAVQDVAFWMNKLASERTKETGKIVTLNCSVEESTVGERVNSAASGGPGLLPHDEFVRDHLTGSDVVVLSVGGNDVALKPTAATIASVFMLTRMPMAVLNAMGRFSPGFAHMEHLFHTEIERIVQRMMPAGAEVKAADMSATSTGDAAEEPQAQAPGTTRNEPPALVVVCMIYYLDQTPGGSWADSTLARLGYDAHPAKLQLIIRLLFERIQSRGFHVTSKAAADGKQPGKPVKVLPFPLFKVLDGTDTNDYVQRVEPSVQGGKKIASALLDFIFEHTGRQSLVEATPAPESTNAAAPLTSTEQKQGGVDSKKQKT
jgi:hypothetical protein